MPEKKKRPLNAFMKALQKAKKSNAESFTYKDRSGREATYKKKISKTGLILYKKAAN